MAGNIINLDCKLCGIKSKTLIHTIFYYEALDQKKQTKFGKIKVDPTESTPIKKKKYLSDRETKA